MALERKKARKRKSFCFVVLSKGISVKGVGYFLQFCFRYLFHNAELQITYDKNCHCLSVFLRLVFSFGHSVIIA